MDDSIKAFIFTISGTLIGSITSIVITSISKKAEAKDNYNQMIIKAAIESWHGAIDIVKQNGKGRIPPLDAYIISSSILFSKMKFNNIKKKDIVNSINEITEINKLINEHYENSYKHD